jgi:hypothetical protein
MCKISNWGYQIWAKQTPTQELKWKEKKNQNQNPNSGTQLPKSQTSKSSTQKQNFSFESVYPIFKMQTKKLKKTGYQICSSKDNTSFPNPPKRIKMKIQSPLFYNTSLQTQARFLPKK